MANKSREIPNSSKWSRYKIHHYELLTQIFGRYMLFINIVKRFTTINWEPIRGKGPFVRALPKGARVLDVGCGNNSPEWFKTVRPDLYYIGIDIADYNQVNDPARFADEYLLTSPKEFASQINKFQADVDAVISCHNIEHCEDPQLVLKNMVMALKPGGKLYLSFPCEASVGFPHRGGCLNFFDDSSHKEVPNWDLIIRTLESMGATIDFASRRYRPFPLWLRGLVFEPLSAMRHQVMTDGSTWALYGFESVIWVSATLAEVSVVDWGAKETTVNCGVNVQPDGKSALWIRVLGVDRFGEVWVEFNERRANSRATVTDTLLTTVIPSVVISTPGKYDVEIVEASGRKTQVGVFSVNP